MAADITAGCLRSVYMTRPGTWLSFFLLLEGMREGMSTGNWEGKPTVQGASWGAWNRPLGSKGGRGEALTFSSVP